MNIVSKAYEFYKAGKFEEALHLYYCLSDIISDKVYRYQIKKCIDKIPTTDLHKNNYYFPEEFFEIGNINKNCYKNITIHKKDSITLNFYNLKCCTYDIKINHSSETIHKNKKSLVVYVRINGKNLTEQQALDFQLQHNGHKAYFYMGGGKNRKESIFNTKKITPVSSINVLSLEISNTSHKLLNLENLSISESNAEQINDLRLSNVIYDRVFNSDIKFILYADMNINIIDGSTIWLSTMANCLSHLGKTAIILKRDITSNGVHLLIDKHSKNENIIYISPKDFLSNEIDIETAIKIIHRIDDCAPSIQGVFVRGLLTAKNILQTRQFEKRSYIYLTDFYSVNKEGFTISEKQIEDLKIICLRSGALLYQTEQIKKILENYAPSGKKFVKTPPAILPDMPYKNDNKEDINNISIVYAGKVSPLWGIEELVDYTNLLRKKGFPVNVTIIAAKFYNPNGNSGEYGEYMRKMFFDNNITLYESLEKDKVIELMQSADYAWCYRPKELEENTKELSCKVVDMAAMGQRCLCYPNEINKDILGENYPFFIKSCDDFLQVMKQQKQEAPEKLLDIAESIRREHSYKKITEKMKQSLQEQNLSHTNKKICFACHDFKFIDSFISHIKSEGVSVLRDNWEWGRAKDLDKSKRCFDEADILFCEWGLANAVWYSYHNTMKKPLFIRIHAQEVHGKAQRFSRQITVENVTKFIFVNENIRNQALKLWSWPIEKTVVIPNYVLFDEYQFTHKHFKKNINLGMVGVIPFQKRLDRAIETLEILLNEGYCVNLYIKGPNPWKPETLPFPIRLEEESLYKSIFEKINNNSYLKENIIFDSFGNDVSLWYKKIDFILSCSEQESFHYALADGVATGCIPIVWSRPDVSSMFAENWIINDAFEASEKIKLYLKTDPNLIDKTKEHNRDLIHRRYGHSHIFKELVEKILNV